MTYLFSTSSLFCFFQPQQTRSPPHAHTLPYPGGLVPRAVPPTQHHAQTGPVMLAPEQLAKLKSELDIVQQNVNVFSEMLTEIIPGQEHPNDLELLQVRTSQGYLLLC